MTYLLPLILIVVFGCVSNTDKGNWREQLPQTKKLAEKGDARSQVYLGVYYLSGQGVPEDPKEAAKWFRKAAEQGDADAQYWLGTVYEEGSGVPQDFEQAVEWFKKAAEQGKTNAQRQLGFAYEIGRGVDRNFVSAYAWYNITQANGGQFAFKNKEACAKRMTSEQIAKAQELSREMVKKNPKLLND